MSRFFVLGVYFAVVVGVFDQLSKFWVRKYFTSPSAQILEIFDWLNFVPKYNRGVTFGLFTRQELWMPLILTAVSVGIVLFVVAWLWRAKSMQQGIALGAIVGGAMGNVVDRLRFGAVFDFIDAHLGGYHWYTFNLADSAIVCGVTWLVASGLRGKD